MYHCTVPQQSISFMMGNAVSCAICVVCDDCRKVCDSLFANRCHGLGTCLYSGLCICKHSCEGFSKWLCLVPACLWCACVLGVTVSVKLCLRPVCITIRIQCLCDLVIPLGDLRGSGSQLLCSQCLSLTVCARLEGFRQTATVFNTFFCPRLGHRFCCSPSSTRSESSRFAPSRSLKIFSIYGGEVHEVPVSNTVEVLEDESDVPEMGFARGQADEKHSLTVCVESA